MPTECCVPGCTGRGGHLIPKNAILRKRWIVAIKRDVGKNFRITSNTVLCHQHFVSSDYNEKTTFGKHENPLNNIIFNNK